MPFVLPVDDWPFSLVELPSHTYLSGNLKGLPTGGPKLGWFLSIDYNEGDW